MTTRFTASDAKSIRQYTLNATEQYALAEIRAIITAAVKDGPPKEGQRIPFTLSSGYSGELVCVRDTYNGRDILTLEIANEGGSMRFGQWEVTP